MSEENKHFYEFGPFRLDPLKRRLMRDGEPVRLTPKAFDLLLVLVEERGRTVEKDELFKKVWPGTVVEENNLNQNITALRKSLGDSRQESQYIATIPGLGYRFVAEVRKVEEGFTQSRKEAKEESAIVARSPARPSKAFRYLLLIVVPLVVAALVYAFYKREKPRPVAISSIMVLPLENLSGDPAEEYFADGMTDALIGDLARIGGLNVISRTSSMHYKRTKKSLPEIAREINVDAVVEGTVQRSGDRVLIRAQLIHAPTDRHLWVGDYNRGMRDVLDLQSEIAQSIARQVQIQMTPGEQARLTSSHPVRPKAFDDYLQDFKRTIELNPNYANAHNFYASYLMSRGRVDESIAASNRARELDPFSLAISAQRGFLLENARRYNEAIEQLRGVIAMDPSHYQAFWFLGHTYAANKQFEEAIAAAEKAVELSERAPGALGMLGLVYGLAGRTADALKIRNELLELNKTRYVTPAALVNVYIGLGDKDQAFIWLEKAYQERSNYLAYLKVFPLIDPLRSDPRYADLVRRIGLPQ